MVCCASFRLSGGATGALAAADEEVLTHETGAGDGTGGRKVSAPVAEPVSYAPEPGLDVQVILQRAAARYPEMRAGAVAELLRGPLLLSYVRELRWPEPLVVWHLLYSWPPDRSRLELRVLEGRGKDSISLLTDVSAWLLLDGQRVEVNRRDLQTKIDSYGIRSLLRVHLEFPDRVATGFDGATMHYIGREVDVSGRELHLITVDGAGNRGRIVKLGIEAGTYLLRKVYYRGTTGLIEYEYSDFRVAFPSLRLPFRIEMIRDGRPADRVTIKRLEVLGQSPGKLLDATSVRLPSWRRP